MQGLIPCTLSHCIVYSVCCGSNADQAAAAAAAAAVSCTLFAIARQRSSSRVVDWRYIHYRLLYAGLSAAPALRCSATTAGNIAARNLLVPVGRAGVIFSRRRRATRSVGDDDGCRACGRDTAAWPNRWWSSEERAPCTRPHSTLPHTAPTAVSRLLALSCWHRHVVQYWRRRRRRRGSSWRVKNDRGHVSARLANYLSTMPPPTVPPTLSSTLLLGVLTASFILPSALPLDDEPEVMLFSSYVITKIPKYYYFIIIIIHTIYSISSHVALQPTTRDNNKDVKS